MSIPKRFKIEGFGRKFKQFTQEDWEDAIIVRGRIKGGKEDWECIGGGDCWITNCTCAPNSTKAMWLVWHQGWEQSGIRLKNFSAKEVGIIGYFGFPCGLWDCIKFKAIFWYDEVNDKRRGRLYIYNKDTGEWELHRDKVYGSGEPQPNTIELWSFSGRTKRDCPPWGDVFDDVWIYICD